MVTRKDYNQISVKAAYSVLIEVARIIGEYRDNIVFIGGWIPQLLFQNETEMHTGSIDIDLALDHRQITDDGYKGIHDLLVDRGYRQGKQPFIFHRTVEIEGMEVSVQVDLLSGEYEGTGKRHRHQRIQEIRARKVRASLSIIVCHCDWELWHNGSVLFLFKLTTPVQIAVLNRLRDMIGLEVWLCLQIGDGASNF